jgi:membrane protease YdiL (CAAX protease family)
MPTLADVAYLVLAFGVPVCLELFVALPRLKARVAAGEPSARLGAYHRAIALQWSIVLPVVVAWIVTGRSWTALGLVPATAGWHGAASVVVVALTAVLGVVQIRGIRRIAANAESRAKYRGRLSASSLILPRTQGESRWFTALSITGGVCEEFLFRGYLPWVLVAFINPGAAILSSAVLFGIGHFYQGWRGALRTGGIALLMSGIVWATGSLFPAMLIHALFNATTGRLAYVAAT